jgi:hypothetical protein
VSLRLELERTWCAPGEILSGRVHVVYELELRSLVVSLDYVEETDDYTEVGRQVSSPLAPEGRLAAGQALPFELAMPDDALPAFRGRHGRLYWRVDAKGDRFGQDAHAIQELALVPQGAGPPMGWYADPSKQHTWRWWDGKMWTSHVS